MVGFDHRHSGTPAESWRRSLAATPTLDLAGVERLVVLAAHPDDETLGAGGVIADAAALGLDIDVLIATNGEHSHPDSGTYSLAQLAEIRRREAGRAVAVLAPASTLTFLDLPDGELSNHVDEIADAVMAICDASGWLLSPWLGDRHPDHAACARAARQARTGMRRWEYPIWLWHWGRPEDAASGAMRRVMVTGAARAKRARAVREYPSQTLPLSAQAGDEAVLTPDFLLHFDRDYDILIQPDILIEPDNLIEQKSLIQPEVSTAPVTLETAQPAVASPEYFPNLYAAADDPWQLAHRWYEARKRSLILACLPRKSFRRAFEPGCATGQLSIELGLRCDEVVAADIADRAVEQARIATASYPNVSVCSMTIPGQWPAGRFDLIVLSEIGYYLDLDELSARIGQSLTEDGVLVLCHWRHPANDHAHTAEHTHAALRMGTGLNLLAAHLEDDFLLDVLTVAPGSVARNEGIVA